MKTKIIFLFSLFLLFSFSHGWNELLVPNPSIDFKRCNMKKASFICNPDNVLEESTTEKLQTITTVKKKKKKKKIFFFN